MKFPLMQRQQTNPVEQILAGKVAPGIYRLRTNIHADYMVAPLNQQGWRGFYIEGQLVKNKADFLRVAGAALSFPDYYRPNWDAFEEGIRDLNWIRAQGYLLIYEDVWHFPRHDRAAWRQARSILAEAVDFWAQTPTPLYVLLRRAWWYAHDIERL